MIKECGVRKIGVLESYNHFPTLFTKLFGRENCPGGTRSTNRFGIGSCRTPRTTRGGRQGGGGGQAGASSVLVDQLVGSKLRTAAIRV